MPQDCKQSTVAKNSNVRRTRASEFLKGMQAIVKQYRPARNTIIHHATRPSLGQVDEYEMWRWLAEQSGEHIVNPHVREFMFRGARSRLKKGREAELTVLLALVLTLMDALVEPYRAKRIGA